MNLLAPMPAIQYPENHVMLDIETLGTKPGCVILSIGAVYFDPYSNFISTNTFYRNIYVPSCTEIGLESDPDTVAWWDEQSDEARDHLQDNQVFIREACQDFVAWLNADEYTRIWCQGATFDAPILEHVLRLVGIGTPWKFWNVRDTRTVYDVCDFDPKTVERIGTYHHALGDAYHQARCVQYAMNPPGFWRVIWDEIKNLTK